MDKKINNRKVCKKLVEMWMRDPKVKEMVDRMNKALNSPDWNV